MRKGLIGILALALVASFALVPAAKAEDSYDSSLILEDKDGNWIVIPGAMQATLDYNSSGSEFEYSLTATGLEVDIEYSLIYYADKPDRFVDWGGDNPGKLIAFGMTVGGNLNLSGFVELGMDLPSWPDANMYEHDYCDAPDYYSICQGAKIWLIPSECYDKPEVTSWEPTRFLFETDLIWYDDIDVQTDVVHVHTNVCEDIIAININPNYLDFGDVFPGDCSNYQNLYIENTGSVDVDVSASTDSEFYQNALKFDGNNYVPINSWGMVVNEGATKNAKPSVCTDSEEEAGGQEGMIVFWATETP